MKNFKFRRPWHLTIFVLLLFAVILWGVVGTMQKAQHESYSIIGIKSHISKLNLKEVTYTRNTLNGSDELIIKGYTGDEVTSEDNAVNFKHHTTIEINIDCIIMDCDEEKTNYYIDPIKGISNDAKIIKG